MKTCPFCAEEIQDAAIKCRYCGSDLTGEVTQGVPPREASRREPVFSEKTYYSDAGVTVTSTRAVFGEKTYSMANITSVVLAEVNPGAGCGGPLLIVGFLLALFLFGSETAGIGVFGILLIIVGFVLASQKSYVVQIGSASGESQAYQSSDRVQIEKIVEAVNRAIIDRR